MIIEEWKTAFFARMRIVGIDDAQMLAWYYAQYGKDKINLEECPICAADKIRILHQETSSIKRPLSS